MYAGSEDNRLLAEKLKTLGVPFSSIDQPENKPGYNILEYLLLCCYCCCCY